MAHFPCAAQGLVKELKAAEEPGRCTRDSVEFIVGGGGNARAATCPARHAAAAAGAPAARPGTVAGVRRPDGAQQERRQILEMELDKERQQASLLRSPDGPQTGPQAEERRARLRRHEENIAALQAEIGRLP
ncbi:Uncharacterised protein [Delftia tsuruhatensis]|uniref:hypothetical protein n=1 Tax=Delftia tsuruhatensis TaxID=180282 RepID=UPI001E77230F|nr:hypothetical protein [Delftia tsuruhatensis]CAB5691589.1 Uncharacterised protein [Delftia tsuruhatensis]CAC9676866.1 Uncharacterised protein [Delftia tsuruhatensis]